MRRFIPILVFFLCQFFTCSVYATDKKTLSILPFASQQGEQQAWLGKGIADMLMRDLSETDSFVILERHELQTFINEMELGQSAFVEKDQAMRVGQVAKVEQVIYGNYLLKNESIEINLLLVDLNTQNIILTGKISGLIDDIHSLVEQLSLDFIKQQKLAVDERSLNNIKFTPTDSISATEYFYRAMDSYDQGNYSEAFSYFYLASKQDPKYLESNLWMGKMLEYLEMDDLAISAYLNLFERSSQTTEAYDAFLFAASLLKKKNTSDAINAYELLANLKPVLPHSIEAAFQLGKLYEQQEDFLKSYNAFSMVDSYHKNVRFTKKKTNNRQSRFYRWHDVLKLSHEAIISMIKLYPKLSGLDKEKITSSPRGLIALSEDNPKFEEKRYGETNSIFNQDNPLGGWREKFYAISVPDGYVATGIDIQLKGRLTEGKKNGDFTMRVSPFPLPRNYHNSWLGVIYGQTIKPTALKKHIPFYGKHQKLLTLHFIENESEVNSWSFKLHLQPESPTSENIKTVAQEKPNLGFYEGQLFSNVDLDEKSFTGISQPLAKYWYSPRQTMSLVNNYQDGLFLVFVKGELGGEQTELMFTKSHDGKSWSQPKRLNINSLSDDFAPKLVRTEDGNLRLFWISNRRGLGWEIWTSRFGIKTGLWDSPSRIPLESFSKVSKKRTNYDASNLLHYAVTQDKRGRWILARRSFKKREVLFLSSNDAISWKQISKQRSIMKFLNPALIQDKSGVYRLAAVGSDQKLHLWSSNDLKDWNKKSYKLSGGQSSSYAMHSIHLYSENFEQLLVLLSDARHGLQYARFNPDTSEPKLDLVKDIGLDGYAISKFNDDRYLVAQRKNDQIIFRQFKSFQTQTPDLNNSGSILYSEYMQDHLNNKWRRIYARMRFIQPDVTTVAVEPDGRVWWGIETGIMTLKGNDFFSADVSDGFFHHHVTDIVPCDGKVFFASKDLGKPVLGIAKRVNKKYLLSSNKIDNENNSITAMHCSQDGMLYIGTQYGKLLSFKNGKVEVLNVYDKEAITAISGSTEHETLWVGTMHGNLYSVGKSSNNISLPKDVNGGILDIGVDSKKNTWVSIEGYGVFSFKDGIWNSINITNDSTNSIYHSISHLVPDPEHGVWMMPASKELSQGIIYHDGTRSRLFNSPDKKIIAPTGIAIDSDGLVWIGTAFDGLFNLNRQAQ